MGGFDFVSHMGQSPIEDVLLTPIVMLTADASEEAVLAARSHKVSSYVAKPVSANTLRRALERALGGTLQ